MFPFHLIKNVGFSFDQTDSNLFFVEAEGGRFCSYNFDDGKINIIRDDANYVDTCCIRNTVQTIDADNRKTLVFDNESMELLQEIPYVIHASAEAKRNRFTSEFYYPRISTVGEKNYGKLRQVTNELIETYPLDQANIYKVISDHYFLTKYQDEIALCSFAGLGRIWSRSFANILRSESRVNYHSDILYDSTLYLFLNDEYFRQPVTFGLDLMTGKVTGTYPEFHGFMKRSGKSLYAIRYGEELQEFDPATGTVKVVNAKESLKENGFDEIDYSCWIVAGKNLFFAQNERGEHRMAGIFDLQKQTIIWKHQFAKDHRYIGEIQLYNNKLLFHMQDKSLHIFDVSEVL